MVGAGVFIQSGSVAQDTAGPAINLSYIAGGFACTLSALAYVRSLPPVMSPRVTLPSTLGQAEYACDYPIAGVAFNFITLTFGEFVGWLIACNLFIEWCVT